MLAFWLQQLSACTLILSSRQQSATYTTKHNTPVVAKALDGPQARVAQHPVHVSEEVRGCARQREQVRLTLRPAQISIMGDGSTQQDKPHTHSQNASIACMCSSCILYDQHMTADIQDHKGLQGLHPHAAAASTDLSIKVVYTARVKGGA